MCDHQHDQPNSRQDQILARPGIFDPASVWGSQAPGAQRAGQKKPRIGGYDRGGKNMILKRSLQVIGAAVMLLICLVTINTIRFGTAPSAPKFTPITAGIDFDAAAGRLAGLVQIKTISHGPNSPVAGDEFKKMRDQIEASFPKIVENLELEVVSNFSLLYRWPGTNPNLKPILFIAHMDVVPAEPATISHWSYPPFSGTIADGFIWGRGTLDMKASLAGILEAVEHLIGQGFKPTRTVYLAFSHDEEVGGSQGTASIVASLQRKGVRLLFTMDEGMPISMGLVPGVASPVALIGLAEKGRVTLELTAKGVGGHSSRPPANSAIAKIGRVLDRLETNQLPARLQSPTVEMFESLAPKLPLGYRLALANQLIFEPLVLSILKRTPEGSATVRTTTAPTIIQGGVKSNVLPAEARAVVDFRILPGDTVKSVTEHVRLTIDDPDISLRQVGAEPADPTPITDRNSPSYQMLEKTVMQVFPDVVVAPSLVIGRTDSHHYSEIADNSFRFVPMRLGTEDLKRIHGIDERIAISNYAEIITFYVQLVVNSAGEEAKL